jgi:hypothetical protein
MNRGEALQDSRLGNTFLASQFRYGEVNSIEICREIFSPSGELKFESSREALSIPGLTWDRLLTQHRGFNLLPFHYVDLHLAINDSTEAF